MKSQVVTILLLISVGVTAIFYYRSDKGLNNRDKVPKNEHDQIEFIQKKLRDSTQSSLSSEEAKMIASGEWSKVLERLMSGKKRQDLKMARACKHSLDRGLVSENNQNGLRDILIEFILKSSGDVDKKNNPRVVRLVTESLKKIEGTNSNEAKQKLHGVLRLKSQNLTKEAAEILLTWSLPSTEVVSYVKDRLKNGGLKEAGHFLETLDQVKATKIRERVFCDFKNNITSIDEGAQPQMIMAIANLHGGCGDISHLIEYASGKDGENWKEAFVHAVRQAKNKEYYRAKVELLARDDRNIYVKEKAKNLLLSDYDEKKVNK